jgi:hypothetical protein
MAVMAVIAASAVVDARETMPAIAVAEVQSLSSQDEAAAADPYGLVAASGYSKHGSGMGGGQGGGKYAGLGI